MSTRYEIAPCPGCGCETGTEVAGPADVREEMEQLWDFHTRRLRGHTPPPMLLDRAAFSQAPPLRIERCTACGLLFRNPRERPEELVETYRDEEAAEAVLLGLFESQRRSSAAQVRRLTRVFGGTGTGLEVGSYVGGFLAAAAAAGWTFRGIDVNPSAIRFAASRGLDVGPGTIEDQETDQAYDVVAFWNCFDQLPDPAAAARAARRLLRDGGLIAVRVPNGAFYQAWRQQLRTPLAPLARAVLAHNNLLSFPYRHGFSPQSLARVLGRAGFRVVHTTGDVLVPVADRWTRPWSAVEERLVKALLRRLPATRAPWLEVYARAV
jgi:2-polyprenyl-3-methyl-5-hydroxy-6-metoxy-1,4-benzoquinol methylase